MNKVCEFIDTDVFDCGNTTVQCSTELLGDLAG